jgi:hypothetical protein
MDACHSNNLLCLELDDCLPKDKDNFDISGPFFSGRRFGEFNPSFPKFRRFDKAEPNSLFRGKYMRNNVIRIWISLICKLSGTPD